MNTQINNQNSEIVKSESSFKNMNRIKRRLKSNFMIFLSLLSAIIGLLFLFFILYTVITVGLKGMSLSLFTQDSAPPFLAAMGEGGLRQAFLGQILLTVLGSLVGIPIGIFGGIYLSEYSNNSFFGKLISNIADVSISIPTIIIGTFIYSLLVKPFGGFNGYAGAFALAFIIIPLIIRTTEESLKLIPWSLREAAIALGAPKFKVVKDIVIKSAITSIITGISLAVARIAGETAPLLFTSFNNNYFSFDLSKPIPSLTVSIFQYAASPYENWIIQAWASSLVITIFILLSNIIIKLFVKKEHTNV